MKRLLLLMLCLQALSPCVAADAAPNADYEPVHWAFSAFFGTGWYQVEDNRSVFILRVQPRQTVRESAISSGGTRTLGLEIRYPVSMGFHDTEDLPGIIEPDNFGTLSFTPGVELEIPVNEHWYLRTNAHLGRGTELDSGDSVWIYYAGIKSRYAFPGDKYEWALLNGLSYAGYTPDRGRSDHVSLAQLGVEFTQPLDTTLAGRELDLNYHLVYSRPGNELRFGLPGGGFETIRDQYEAGVAVNLKGKPFRLWFIDIEQFGLAYQFSHDGSFRAITINLRSWFTR